MNLTPTPVQESLSELLRRAEVTSKARYTAARRMELHSAFSQWTLAYLAVGQLVISLVVALKLHSNFSSAYVDFGAIFFGVLVLAYSLLLGMGNYAARAIILHSCGVELGALSRSLHYKSRDIESTKIDYEFSANRYYEILAKCENHVNLDYLVAHSDLVGKKLSDAQFLSSEHLFARIEGMRVFTKIWLLRCTQFAHYVASMLLISSWIYMLVAPKHT